MPLNTSSRRRGMPQGIAHRARLSALILPKLAPGCLVPRGRFCGRLLGISASEGLRHMRRVLAEAGVVTETRGRGKGRRIYVTAMPQQFGEAA